uniref:Peptidase S1 domain-containing protein n=1 Tax=Anopheles christyi TaxID=43041 RepID=A0A182JNY8_9DIPT
MRHQLRWLLLLFGALCTVGQMAGVNRLVCGRRKVKSVYLIHNGIDARPGHWPWHAVIYQRANGVEEYKCGGSIIDEDTILTSAHCVTVGSKAIPADQITVGVGRTRLNELSEYTATYGARQVIVHPGFNVRRFKHDIALIKLVSNITMAPYVQPVCLWTMDSNQELIVGKNGTVLGFGLTEQDVVSEQLKQAMIGVVDTLTCIANDRAAFGTYLTSEMFCGGGREGVSACNGDSGGGLFLEVEGRWFVRGIVSFIPLRKNTAVCDTSKFTAFADIAKYLKWIEQYIDPRVLVFESDDYEVNYEEKLPLFDLSRCGIKSDTFLADGSHMSFPWFGFAMVHQTTFVKCVVTLVSEWYAVGPASCFENDGNEVRIRLGDYEDLKESKCFDRNGKTVCANPAQTLKIQRIIIHPRYNDKEFTDNIALVELLTPADTSQPNVRPICVPVTKQLYTNQTSNLLVASYSALKRSFVDKLARFVNSSQCIDLYLDAGLRLNLDEKRICGELSAEAKSDCAALKSGATLQETLRLGTSGDERYVLRGFDLFGTSCDTTLPTVYNNLYAYLDWMLYNMRFNEVDDSKDTPIEAKWANLQKDDEKLRLFDMSSCGLIKMAQIVSSTVTYNPWIGSLEGLENVSNSPPRSVGKVILISERYALAPAHIFSTPVAWRSIILGYHDVVFELSCRIKGCEPPYQMVEIKQVLIHPEFNEQSLHLNNIALIELLEPANTTKSLIGPICMPLMEELRNSTPLELKLATDLTESRKVVRLSPANCQAQLIHEGTFIPVQELPLCADDYENDGGVRFSGHSGSALQGLLYFAEQKRYFLSGLSHLLKSSDPKAPDLPYLLSDVNQHLEWILENVSLNVTDISQPPAATQEFSRKNRLPVKNIAKRRLFNFNTCGTYINSTFENYELEPWIGFVERWDALIKSDQYTHCVVTLISEWYAVGPASCLGHDTKETFVQLGGFKKVAKDECTDRERMCRRPTQTVPIVKIIVHPAYNGVSHEDDIALVQLATTADLSQPHIQPICLPILDELRSYDVASLTSTSFSKFSSSFMTVQVNNRLVSPIECQRRWDGLKLNVRNGGTGLCVLLLPDSEGDGCYFIHPGFPLHTTHELRGQGKRFLRAILTVEPGSCSSYIPAIYTDVDTYLDWILENMDEKIGTQTLSYDLTEQLLLCLLVLVSVLCVASQSLGPNRLTCGKRRVKTIHLVQNGIDAKPGHWPWHAAIFHRKGDRLDYACGGSIIDENTILTAAHCVFLANGIIPADRISVHLGRIHLKEVSEFVQEHTVQEVIVHPGYNSSRFVNDIGLIKLTGSISMTEFVQPVCLWTMDKNQELIVGRNGTLVGFGLNEQDVVSEQLKQAPIGVVDALTCIKSDRLSFANQLTSEMFCGGGQSNVSACNGDSGGGLFFNVDGKWFVRGVVSFIPVRKRTGLCDPSKYTAFADVAKYLGWIDQYIDRRVLVFDTDELEVDYEEKLPLFNLTTCGINSESFLPGGQPAPLPWLGFALTQDAKVKCVVTLVSEWYVVGPASCFDKSEQGLRILFGGYEDLHEPKCFERNGTTICANPTQSRQIARVIAHPIFSKNTINDDIALIELQSPADTTQPHVKPICLPVTPALYTNRTENFSVLAFRLADATIIDQSVNYVEPAFCTAVHVVSGYAIDNEEKSICASVPEADIGNCGNILGQGAPLQERVAIGARERYVLRGFDLLGLTCAGDSPIPVLFVNVYSYLDWMLYNMRYIQEESQEERELIANLTLAQWKKLQQEPGSEKLKLFNMESCGQNVVEQRASGAITLIPWIGTLKTVDNPTRQETVPDGLVVLISERYALTAANVFRSGVQWRSIVLGFKHYDPLLEIACAFGSCDPPYQAVEIKNITIYPIYNGTLNEHNIALIELVEPANITKRYISPICMPLIEEFRNSTPLELMVPSYIYHDQSTQLESLDLLNCQERFAQQNAPITLSNQSRCAVSLDKDAKEPAALKSGAPLQTLLQVGQQKRYFLSGMNSFMDLVNYHNPSYPYLFTDTNAYLDWILENMKYDRNGTLSTDQSSKVARVNLSPTQNTSRRRLFNFKTCGVYTKGSTLNATYETEPWHGFVYEWNPTYNLTLFTRCTVTLVSEWYAIGVASCLKQDTRLFVQFGGYVESDLGDNCWDADGTTICRPKTHRVAVNKIIVHPHYNRTGYTHDIALVQLATPAVISQPHVQPICLPILDEVRNYDVTSSATVTFGLAHGSFITSKIDQTRYVTPVECQRRWDGMALQLQIKHTKQCNLMVRDQRNECFPILPGFPLHTTQELLGEQRHFIRGLLALRPELCSNYYPAIYTDVDAYLDWILDSMDEQLGTSRLSYNLTEHLIFTSK